MGLLSAPEEEEIRQLEAGDSDEGSDNVVEAEVEAVEEGDAEEDDGISEAELLEHFKSLEKNAEA